MCDALLGHEASSTELIEAARNAPPEHLALVKRITQAATRIKPLLVARVRMESAQVFSERDMELIDAYIAQTRKAMKGAMKRARRFQGRVAECRKLLRARVAVLDAIDNETGVLRANPKLFAALRSRHIELSNIISS